MKYKIILTKQQAKNLIQSLPYGFDIKVSAENLKIIMGCDDYISSDSAPKNAPKIPKQIDKTM